MPFHSPSSLADVTFESGIASCPWMSGSEGGSLSRRNTRFAETAPVGKQPRELFTVFPAAPVVAGGAGITVGRTNSGSTSKMESYLNRANAVFCSMMLCLSALALGNIGSSYFLTDKISGSISARSVYAFGYNYALNGDQAVLALDIKANLRGLFQWNAKQLFVFVVAEYESAQHPINQVVVFDRIITDENAALLDLVNVPAKYHLRDKGRGLRGRDVTLKLQVVYHPIVGRISTYTVASSTFRMPANYDRVTQQKQNEQRREQVREGAAAASNSDDTA